MVGLPRSIIKKYGVSKKAWAVFRSGRPSGGVKTMARRRKYSGFRRGRRSSGSGLMGLVIPIAAGALGGQVAPAIPIVNTMPYSNVVAGAGAGYLVKKSTKGALLGAAGAFFGNMLLGGAKSTGSGYSSSY